MTFAPRRAAGNQPSKSKVGVPNELEKTPQGKQATRPCNIVVQPVESTGVDTPIPSSSSLPTWLDGLASADQVRPTDTDHGEPNQLENMDHMSWELRTETVVDEREYHDPSITLLRASHARQVGHYKNLLIRAQSASSTALHELHTRLHELQVEYDHLRAEHTECDIRREEDKKNRDFSRSLGENGLETTVRSMSKQERTRILGLLAEACDPSDITAQITRLERYKRSRFDILGRLGPDPSVSIMSSLDVKDILSLRLVSNRYRYLTAAPALWREFCKRLDEGYEGIAGNLSICDWETVYRILHSRERNWSHGLAQNVELVRGHTDYVTSLSLKGDTLVSGSYDGTVRVWGIRSGPKGPTIESPVIIPSKSVSGLEYWPDKQVIATGYHDLGRIQIWKRNGSKWEAGHLLSGHLHGIRTIAMNDQYLVSAGADKVIVVWDYETGEKITRFGQQTNICVGIHLVHDKIISLTVDGVIRCFDIAQRKMVAQYRLGDLCKNTSVGGLDSNASVLWVEGRGRHLTCGTKTATVKLEWQETPMSRSQPVEATAASGTSTPRSRRVSLGVVPSSTSSPLRRPPPSTRTPSKRISSLGFSPVKTPTALAPSTRGSVSTTKRTSSLSTTATSATLVSPSPSSKPQLSKSPLTGSPHRATTPELLVPATTSKTETRLVPNFAITPKVSAVLQTPEVERGTVDSTTGRMVLCQRFASRSTSRNIYIANKQEGESAIVPLKGAWAKAFQKAELGLPRKNPMSVVMDRNKIIYGCADGTIVIVGFQ